MTDKNMRDLRDAATRRARQQVENLDLSNRAKQQLEHLDLSSLASHLPKNVNVDWDLIQQREDRAASRGFIGGLLLGTLLGAVLALVFAPRRGSETRESIAGAAGDIKEKATGLVGQAKDSGAELASNVSDFRAKAEKKASDESIVDQLASNDDTGFGSDLGGAVQDSFGDAQNKADEAKRNLKSVLDEAKAKTDA